MPEKNKDMSSVAREDNIEDNKQCSPVISNVETKLLQPEKQLSPKQKKRKLLGIVLFILFNAIAIGVVLLLEIKDEKESFAGAAALGQVINKNFIFILIAFLAYAVHVLCDAVAYFALIRQCGYGNQFWLSFRVALLGKYYDNITPWSTGGQPFQMAYMAKANIDAPTACTLPIVKYAIRMFYVNALIITLFIVVKVEVSLFLKICAYLGMFGTAFLPILLIIFSRNVPFMLKITRKVVGLLYKLKIIKNYEKQLAKAQDLMDSFLAAFKYLGQHKSMIVIVGLLSLLDCIAVSSLPYFIIRAFGTPNLSFFKTMAEALYATLSAGLLPTPGSSGASEGSFYSIFGSAVPSGYLFWAVLFWRIMVFYLPIVLGLTTLFIDWLKGKTKITLAKSDITWRFKKTLKEKKDVEPVAITKDMQSTNQSSIKTEGD